MKNPNPLLSHLHTAFCHRFYDRFSDRRLRAALCALVFWGAIGCQSTEKQSADATNFESETHFLSRCESACPGDLECLCGVCTLSCTENAECSDAAEDAVCRSGAGSCGDGVKGLCDVECDEDADCDNLSTADSCVDGRCRPSPSGSGDVTSDDGNLEAGSSRDDSSTLDDAKDAAAADDASDDAPADDTAADDTPADDASDDAPADDTVADGAGADDAGADDASDDTEADDASDDTAADDTAVDDTSDDIAADDAGADDAGVTAGCPASPPSPGAGCDAGGGTSQTSDDPCTALQDLDLGSCQTDDDCTLISRGGSCCDGQFSAVPTAIYDEYSTLSAACLEAVPPQVCECPETLPKTDDGRHVLGVEGTVGVECIAGTCRSYAVQAPCDESVPVFRGLDYDYAAVCSRDEICVRSTPDVDSADTYSCVANPCDGEVSCECAAADACEPELTQCTTSTYAQIVCY